MTLRLTELSNVYKRRTLKVQYGNTQAYPYAATLSTHFDRTANQLTGTALAAGSKAAINPGSVAIKLVGEIVTLSGSTEAANTNQTDTVAAATRGFGLFGNFVGGQLDELGSRSEVSVWRGAGSVYEVLAPAFDDTGLAADGAAEDGTAGTETYMTANSQGLLVFDALAVTPYTASHMSVVRLINRLSANAIIVECLV